MIRLIPLAAIAGLWLTCDSTGATPSARAIDTVVVTPPHLEIHTGDSLRFAGWGKNSNGDSVAAPLAWTATGGVILPDGRFYAPQEAGFYTVSASYGFQTVGQATVVVRPPDSLMTGIAVDPKTLTMNGGDTTRIQAYAIYAVPPRMPIVPTYFPQGGAIQSDGLFTAGTDPGLFPIVARDSAGRFADTALVTINGGGVATLEVDPPADTVPQSGTLVLTGNAKDSHGNALNGRSFTWTTNAPGVATVLPNAGIVTGVGPGTAQITASAGNTKGSAAVTVIGPNNGPWPNEPADFNLISDQPWDLLTSLNWTVQFGTAIIGADPTAPFSPSGVLTIIYPIGFVGGSAPGTLIHDVPNLKALYSGLWWKASDPWQGHPSNVNKIEFAFMTGDPAVAIIEFYGPPGGPYELHCVTELPGDNRRLKPNVHNVPVTMGVWHRIEWLLVYNTSVGPPNGITRWWMDGVLIGDWRDVLFPSGQAIGTFKLSPTWGGTEGVKSELDFYWYDHTRISGK